MIVTTEAEAYAANCVRIKNTVIMPEGFPDTERQLREAGFQILTTPMSEIEKQDGGLSCLSVRMPKII